MTPYRDLAFPEPGEGRPYVFLNMIATVDGKTVSGTRDECAIGLGSAVDKATMAYLDGFADAVIAGASTVRTAHPNWRPKVDKRIAVSNSGRFDYGGEFFTQGTPFVALPKDGPDVSVASLRQGEGAVDLAAVLRELRQDHGIRHLLAVGGPSLNAELLRQGLVDEIFLTVAPRLKLGEGLPTLAGGEPLPREAMLRLTLLECHPVESELFLRYRVAAHCQ